MDHSEDEDMSNLVRGGFFENDEFMVDEERGNRNISAEIAAATQQPPTSETTSHSAAGYSNMRRIQRERRRRENLEGESHESGLRREMDRSERRLSERDPIIPPHDTISTLQEENRKLREENRKLWEENEKLKMEIKQVENALSQSELALKTEKEEGEMLGREIGLAFAVERLKRINAVEAMHSLLDDKEKFEGWQGFQKLSASKLHRLYAEIATERQEREENPHSGLKSGDYRVRVMKGKDGEKYTVFDHDNPRPRRLRSEEDDEASEYADLVSDAEWIYEKMTKKREMDQRLEMERIREIQEEILTSEQPDEDIGAQKLKEDEGLDKLEEETRRLGETEEEMEDDEEEIKIYFRPSRFENECQIS